MKANDRIISLYKSCNLWKKDWVCYYEPKFCSICTNRLEKADRKLFMAVIENLWNPERFCYHRECLINELKEHFLKTKNLSVLKFLLKVEKDLNSKKETL